MLSDTYRLWHSYSRSTRTWIRILIWSSAAYMEFSGPRRSKPKTRKIALTYAKALWSACKRWFYSIPRTFMRIRGLNRIVSDQQLNRFQLEPIVKFQIVHSTSADFCVSGRFFRALSLVIFVSSVRYLASLPSKNCVPFLCLIRQFLLQTLKFEVF